jgi:hypothetical protein
LCDSLDSLEEQPRLRYVGFNNASFLTDIEGSIDIQWIMGVGRNAVSTYWGTPGGQ